ncbi:DUF2092 domain-containing protein [bacterium]|nr:DUF2092 domain-containing protein [bacterium]
MTIPRKHAAARAAPLLVALVLGTMVCACAQQPLTPEQIVARLTNAYASCQSYEAIGESSIIVATPGLLGRPVLVMTNSQRFRIQFQRPASLRFEFDHADRPGTATLTNVLNMATWPRTTIVLCTDAQQTRISSEKARQYWQGERLSDGLVQVMALAMNRGGTTLALLTRALSDPIHRQLQHVTAVREEDLDGTPCYVLAGEYPGGAMPYELWIGKHDYLLRKRTVTVERGSDRRPLAMEETHRDLRINQTIPPSTFHLDVPEDWRETTNALSLLPDVERVATAVRRMIEARGRATQGSTQSVAEATPPALPTGPKKIRSLGAFSADQVRVVNPKTPTYIDCQPDQVTLYPGGATVTWDALQKPGNAVEALLDRVEQHRADEFVVVMVRPGSVKVFRFVRNLIAPRSIDVGYDAVDAEFKVHWNADTKTVVNPEPVAAPSSSRPAPPPVMPTAPVLTPQPRTVPASTRSVFFECRGGEIFFINKDPFEGQVRQVLVQAGPPGGDLTVFMKAIQGANIGDAAYQVDLKYVLTGQFGVEPRPGAHGDTVLALREPDAGFHKRLRELAPERHSLVFLVRDDSFHVYRRARAIAEQAGFQCGWELLGLDQSIKFGLRRAAIAPK